MQRKNNNKKRIDPELYNEIYTIVKSLIDQRVKEIKGEKDELSEIKRILVQIAENQRKTEENIRELAEAQRKTEERLNELAEAQKKTEERMAKFDERITKLEEAIKQLTEAQKKTEQRLNGLAEAQKKTEIEIQNLIRADNEMKEEMRSIRRELGGLSRSFSYAFENEAFRALPAFLERKFGIRLKERLVREEIGGKEINIFGIGEKDGKEVIVVGEAKARLDEVRAQDGVFDELEDKVKAVKGEYGEGVEIIRILITHHATKGFVNMAKQRGVIVIQSFEW